MATNPNPNKRQKIANQVGFHINDIPDEALAVAASFLPKPSRALFAAAMAAPSSSWRDFSEREGPQRQLSPSPACQAILSLNPAPLGERSDRDEMWSTLDFADVDRALAGRLSDDDVGAALACVHAATNLETLKLTGCVNITGHGLEPLRGSKVLRQIDVSLVGLHESPAISPEPRMSEDAVLPILDSIIDAGGSSLKQLQLPKKFRTMKPNGEPGELIENFVFKYDRFMEQLGGTCKKCNVEEAYWGNENINGNPWYIDDEESQFYGCQNFTCYKCTGHFCLFGCVAHCMECEKAFCTDCDPILECTACRKGKCRACWDRKPCSCTC